VGAGLQFSPGIIISNERNVIREPLVWATRSYLFYGLNLPRTRERCVARNWCFGAWCSACCLAGGRPTQSAGLGRACTLGQCGHKTFHEQSRHRAQTSVTHTINASCLSDPLLFLVRPAGLGGQWRGMQRSPDLPQTGPGMSPMSNNSDCRPGVPRAPSIEKRCGLVIFCPVGKAGAAEPVALSGTYVNGVVELFPDIQDLDVEEPTQSARF
jgi:hypothetical protein